MKEPNSKSNLMAMGVKALPKEDPRGQLFLVKIQLKKTFLSTLIDTENAKKKI